MNQSEEKIVIHPEEKIKIVNQSEEKIQIVNHSEEKIVNHPGQTPDHCRTVASSCNSHLSPAFITFDSASSSSVLVLLIRKKHVSSFRMVQQCLWATGWQPATSPFSTQRLPFLCTGGHHMHLTYKGACWSLKQPTNELQLKVQVKSGIYAVAK